MSGEEKIDFSWIQGLSYICRYAGMFMYLSMNNIYEYVTWGCSDNQTAWRSVSEHLNVFVLPKNCDVVAGGGGHWRCFLFIICNYIAWETKSEINNEPKKRPKLFSVIQKWGTNHPIFAMTWKMAIEPIICKSKRIPEQANSCIWLKRNWEKNAGYENWLRNWWLVRKAENSEQFQKWNFEQGFRKECFHSLMNRVEKLWKTHPDKCGGIPLANCYQKQMSNDRKAEWIK